MNLYIQISNGKPINHPASEQNLLDAFNAIPSDWEPFVRIDAPILGPYELFVSNESSYEKVNNVWTDVWSVRQMTNQEKIAKQQEVQNKFRNRPQAENWASWVLDESTCTMIPPFPRPNIDEIKISQGIYSYWCGADNNWKDTPPLPNNGKAYKFDFFAWTWVEVTA